MTIVQINTLRKRLPQLPRHNTCNAGTIMTSKKEIRRLLGTKKCRLQNAERTGYVFVLYPDNEFKNLPEVRLPPGPGLPAGGPGPAVVLPTDPGPPTATSYTQTAQWNYRKKDWDNYLTILEFTREAIRYSLPQKARKCHICPDMKDKNLLSVLVLCDAGCMCVCFASTK